MNASVLILEQERHPEHDLFQAAATHLDVKVVQEDVRLLKFDSAKSALTQSGRSVSRFDAIVFRTYRDPGLLKQVAHIAKQNHVPIYGYDPLDVNAFNDKLEDHWTLERSNVSQPKYWQLSDHLASKDQKFVIKKIWGFVGKSVHLLTCEKAQQLPGHEWFVQEFVDAKEDWRIYLNAGRALPFAIKRKPADGDFRTNHHQGGSSKVISLNEVESGREMAELAEAAGRCLGRPYAGVDVRCKGSAPLILEVNRTPRLRIEKEYAEKIAMAWLESWLNQRLTLESHIRFSDALFEQAGQPNL